MATKGSSKALSVKHEERIATWYGGKRSRSSGGAQHDQGDVRIMSSGKLIECKYTGSPDRPLKRKPTLVSQMEKIADEAWAEGRDPMLALRYYLPDSPLSGPDGWIDFAVRRVLDDV